MSRLPKHNSIKLWNLLVKEVRDEFKRQGRPESWREIQQITSKEVYPKFKGKSWRQVKKKDVDKLISKKYFKKCGNIFEVPIDDLAFEWFIIDEFINTLPKDIKVRFNAGDIGQTRIDLVEDFQLIDLIDIREKVREEANNESGFFFIAEPSLLPSAPQNSDNLCDFFLDFIFQDENGNIVGGADFRPIPNKTVRKLGYTPEKTVALDEVEKEKRRRRRELEKQKKEGKLKRPKKPKPEKEKGKVVKLDLNAQQLQEFNRQIELQLERVKEAREDFKLDLITKAEFRAINKEAQDTIKRLSDNFQKGGKLDA